MRGDPRSLVVLVFAFGVGCASPRHVASPSMGFEPSDAVIATGLGEAKGAPDVATVTIGVQRRGSHAQQLVSEANAALAKVVEALVASGVARSDLQTSQVNVGLEELPPDFHLAPPPPESLGAPGEEGPLRPGAGPERSAPPPFMRSSTTHVYNVSLTVTAKVRQMDRVGEVMAAAFSAGANQAYGIQLGWEDPNAWLDKARRAAVEDARRRAKELAQLGEVKLSHVLSIVEQNCGAGSGLPWSPYAAAQFSAPMAAPMPGMPFEGGVIVATCTVRAAFAIER